MSYNIEYSARKVKHSTSLPSLSEKMSVFLAQSGLTRTFPTQLLLVKVQQHSLDLTQDGAHHLFCHRADPQSALILTRPHLRPLPLPWS